MVIGAETKPLSDEERDQLEAALDRLPPPLEPLDISALDGFLVGVLLQPESLPPSAWLPYVLDTDGRAPPVGAATALPIRLILRRHVELDHAIAARQWFDPWVFELEVDAEAGGVEHLPSQVVLPWVAGFAAALDTFGGLLALPDEAVREPLAELYAHFDPDDLEDVDDLQVLIDDIEPPETVTEAVENLVRCTLLLADASRPRPAGTAARRRQRNPRRP